MKQEEVRIAGHAVGNAAGAASGAAGGAGAPVTLQAPDEVQPEPLSMAFPRGGFQKQLTYILLFPIIFPLWLTLPDTRSPKGKSRLCSPH